MHLLITGNVGLIGSKSFLKFVSEYGSEKLRRSRQLGYPRQPVTQAFYPCG